MDLKKSIDDLLSDINSKLDSLSKRISNLESNEPPTSVATTAKYVLEVGASSLDPADGTTYFFGGLYSIGPVPTNPNFTKLYFQQAGTVKKISIFWWGALVAGSNENISIYIRINNTTDTLIATIGNTNAQKEFTNNSLSISVVAGDYFEIKIVSPTWSTNPSGVVLYGQVYIE